MDIKKQAEDLFFWAKSQYDGDASKWEAHSINTARAAEWIAAYVQKKQLESGVEAAQTLDPAMAYACGYLHDIGNMVNRCDHSQSGALIAYRILTEMNFPPEEIGEIVTAIGNHDEGTGVPVSPLAAAIILADKSDVRRNRVHNQDQANFDIHDRVNYSVTKSELKINEAHTIIKLKLSVDTHYSSVMEFFEIFMQRMILCRKAAETLGLQFKLIINEQQLI